MTHRDKIEKLKMIHNFNLRNIHVILRTQIYRILVLNNVFIIDKMIEYRQQKINVTGKLFGSFFCKQEFLTRILFYFNEQVFVLKVKKINNSNN